MAKVYIKELNSIASTPSGDALIAAITEPDGVVTEQTVAIAAGNTQSAAFNAQTQWIEISADAICSYLIGSNPTATVSNARLAANERVLRRVKPGQILATITNT